MTNYTKGEWKVEPTAREWIRVKRISVAKILDTVPNEEFLGNGNLISAAPEMYEALKKILANCEFNESFGGLGTTIRLNPTIEMHAAIIEAKQALNKTEWK